MADRFDEVIAELRNDRREMRREFASWSAHIDRLQEQTDDNIRFLRELNRRGELALRELVRSQTAMREEIRASIETLKGQTESLKSQTETLKGQTETLKSQTETLKSQTETLKSQTETLNSSNETIKGNNETMKAHTRAIYALVDRLEGGGGLAPAT